ncbi:UvrD-like helicase C-terminal domain-containing protein [Halobacterium jilantaiense]|uniref:DNA 3'-5' helicase n=2 Tax=Halobacterium jilantaiense TaxID=355548 RepID=A0A1I0QP78_9EURY|nr:UvrD-like helicase C-terminal domain-containing protein [Halobacterium jilantaiense]
MAGMFDFVRGLFSSSAGRAESDEPPSERPEPDPPRDLPDTDVVIKGGDGDEGVAATRDELREWQSGYADDYRDYLTVEDALEAYQRAETALDRLAPIRENPGQFSSNAVEAAETLHEDIQRVREFVEHRDSYNEAWLDAMKAKHGDELNSYFGDGLTHTDQQFRAIFSNDNFNRVNAAAGTGKTTTFGRRVNFVLSEYDDVSASDLLAITFTRNGVSEMESELAETFDITGVEVSTINAYCKSVAEAQYPDIELVVGEAKTTEIAAIWRAICTSEQYSDAHDAFLSAWKDAQYDPNDYDVVRGVYEELTEKSGVTVGDESVPMDSIPEEGLAHEAIARFLVEHDLDYDYQVHLDWAHSASGGFVMDFRLVDAGTDETVYIEYCASEATRADRPAYRNSNSERPETVERLFEPNEHLDTDTSDRTGIVLDGDAILGTPSDELDWDDQRTRERFRGAVRERLAAAIEGTTVTPGTRLRGDDLADRVYDHKVLFRDVVETVETFITQARVREWDPERAASEVREYLDQAEDVDDGVPAFCRLALAAYKRFDAVFDNRTKTDFHGSVVLTRDLLDAGEVDDEFLYPYVFVDEMQDLNQVQFGVVRALADQIDDVRVFGVGDDWQSIFGFQGARPDLFIDYGDVLGAGDYEGLPDPVSVFTDDNPMLSSYDAFADTRLEDNFRCPNTVVDASNCVIRNNEIRTEKDPDGSPEGTPIDVHHLGCDTYEYKRNVSMRRKIESLVSESPHPPRDVQVLLRQQDGDPEFYYSLVDALPDAVDIRTAHDAKGSEAKHVIVPKVSEVGGYPSTKADRWVEPVKQPPDVYEAEAASYKLEEERRLFYVAVTRAVDRLDVLTVQGAESVFVEELPDHRCEHHRPLSDAELDEIETDYECRRPVSGSVDAKFNDNFATLDWDGRGLIDLNLYDATAEQTRRLDELAASGGRVTLANCGIQYRDPQDDDADYQRLQLQVDEDVTIES